MFELGTSRSRVRTTVRWPQLLVLLLACTSAALGMSCSEKSKSDSDSGSVAEVPRPVRKKFMLENQGRTVEVSVPKAEGETTAGTYQVLVRELSGPAERLTGDRRGYLRDAWFVDVDSDGDSQMIVWVEPDSGPSQLDWYELRSGTWQQRSLPVLEGKWTYRIRRGVLFAEPTNPKSDEGYTYSSAKNDWTPGLPVFE